ncbi:glutamate--tRNA ligase [Carboxydochorda subterranea]|uniref:Glutamate--tRNA ligase n=1 Tax=Carboxydichorda subterranea TaxID=3109565 RepID=A0ABZ1BW17_9FIRM|nr:glutamate--tRNA ligase [Limnochorda sp. L945t]WRP16327.1 glutamate--tRNA ligase [Limnochorda sp. L945t]
MNDARASGAVRVRYAPSPTGYPHVGGVRTALYNWLFARHHGGRFVLRLEDTDQARSTEESARAMIDGLRWLGLDWDEGPDVGGPYGPYRQTQRQELYRAYARRLVEMGRAYPCYCTPEELQARRQEALRRGEAPKYDRHCLHLSEAERRRLKEEGRPEALRFLMDDEGETVVHDLVRGEVRFENALLDDFVIMKSDGLPTYNFAVVVDDLEMHITHVIRGDEHLSNTPRQVQVYRALGVEPPAFAHLSILLAPDRSKLSKRHGAQSVDAFREMGYLPEAILNYLALLGWGYDAEQQIFSIPELVEKFSLERVSKNPAVFDIQKLEWMNGYYVRQLPVDELARRSRPFLEKAGLVQRIERGGEAAERTLHKALALSQSRLRHLADVPEWVRYYFEPPAAYDEKAARKHLLKPGVPALLDEVAAGLEGLEPFDEGALEGYFIRLVEQRGLKLGDVLQPVRVAVTGKDVSPGMFEVLALVGRQASVERLRRAAQWAQGALQPAGTPRA